MVADILWNLPAPTVYVHCYHPVVAPELCSVPLQAGESLLLMFDHVGFPSSWCYGNIIWDNSGIFHKWSHNLGSCLALEKTVANIITLSLLSYIRYFITLCGAMFARAVLANIDPIREKYQRIRTIPEICSISGYQTSFFYTCKRVIILEGAFCAVNLCKNCCQVHIAAKPLCANCAPELLHAVCLHAVCSIRFWKYICLLVWLYICVAGERLTSHQQWPLIWKHTKRLWLWRPAQGLGS